MFGKIISLGAYEWIFMECVENKILFHINHWVNN